MSIPSPDPRNSNASADREQLLARIAELQAECDRLGRRCEPGISAGASASDEWVHLITDAIPQIVWTVDSEGRFDFANQQWSRYTGVVHAPCDIPEFAARFVHPADAPAALETWEQAWREGRRMEVEYRIRSVSGEYRWFLVRAEPYHSPETGEIVRWFATSTDITRRKDAEEEIRGMSAAAEQQRRTFEAMLSSTEDFIYLFDLDGRFTYVNRALLELWGREREQAVGRNFQELGYPPELVELHREQIAQVIRTRHPLRAQNGYLSPDGEEGEYEYIFVPVLDDAGEVTALAGVTRNITESKRAAAEREQLLRDAQAARREAEAAERQLQVAFTQAPALVAVTEGSQHCFVLANPGFEQIVGRGDLVGRTVWQALPELEAQGIFALLDQVYATGQPYVASEQRVLLPRDQGEPYEGWYNFVYQPLVDADGQVTGILQHAVEVTQQVRSRMEVEESRRAAESRAATLSAVIESIPDALYVGSLEGITAANGPALEQLGFRSVEELRRAVPDLADEIQTRDVETRERLATDDEPFVRALVRGERVVRDVLVRHRGTGQDRVVRCSAAPVRLDGEVIAAVAVNTDVTELRRVAEERERLLLAAEQARAEAERANRGKSEFLAVMSHELRTPLNAIAGYVELMEMGIHGPVTEPQRTSLGRIQLSQQHLLGLINDVLNYAKLETGSVRYDIADVRVRDVLATAESLVEPQVRAKELALRMGDAPPEMAVRADPEKLRQILVNLLSNAIKFTGRGGRIEVTCRSRDAAVDIVVRDTGMGIPADKHEAIFEPFVQVRADLTRSAEGTGLGLAISRDLARAMDGDLTVESTPGQGSAFSLRLPLAGPRPS